MLKLKLNPKLIITFKLQMDKQTKRINQTLKTYLRNYVNYKQNN